jgi:7-cyano-7-deazaguanine synthase
MSTRSALVLFSGGQDSATCLIWALAARERFGAVDTVGFDYRQRHHIELDVRPQFLAALRARFPALAAPLGSDTVLDAGVIPQLGATAMTHDQAITFEASGLPSTFVPGRNLLFLTLAAALGYRRGHSVLVTGVCETDYSGYPDCRDDTIKALQVALGLGLDQRLVIETPLMWRDKAQTWAMAHDIGQAQRPGGGADMVELIAEHTHTCYLGERAVRHEWGYGCGSCPACLLRQQGWQQWMALQSS